MKHLKYLFTLVAFLSASSLAFADRHYGNHGHQGGKYNDKHNVYGKHRGNSYSYNNKHYRQDYNRQDYYRYNDRYYRYNDGRSYRNHRGYYNNYRPYNQSRYHYRPLRGLGYYFTRSGYGYGHWHDGMWCATVHPQAYYYDYYSNYPYNDGWRFGDGDFGLNFYFDY